MEGQEELVEETPSFYTNVLVCPLVTLLLYLKFLPFILSPASYPSYKIWLYSPPPSVMKDHQFIRIIGCLPCDRHVFGAAGNKLNMFHVL